VLNVVGATVTVTSVNQAPPDPVVLSSEELSARYDTVLAINPGQTQAIQQEGQSEEGPPQDILDALQEVGEQLNKAVNEGLQQQQHFGQLDLSRNCAAPLTAYYAQKENDYGNKTYS